MNYKITILVQIILFNQRNNQPCSSEILSNKYTFNVNKIRLKCEGKIRKGKGEGKGIGRGGRMEGGMEKTTKEEGGKGVRKRERQKKG